ncbi:MAG: hypothetical protein WCG27_03420 [Pseudomonadota bacterium]
MKAINFIKCGILAMVLVVSIVYANESTPHKSYFLNDVPDASPKGPRPIGNETRGDTVKKSTWEYSGSIKADIHERLTEKNDNFNPFLNDKTRVRIDSVGSKIIDGRWVITIDISAR